MSNDLVNRRVQGLAAEAGLEKPPVPPRRASRVVMLGLLGVGALAGGYFAHDYFAGDEEEQAQEPAQQRNAYTTREECERNYSPQQCTQGQAQRSGMGFIPMFFGPYYGGAGSMLGRANDPGPGRVSQGAFVEQHPRSASRRSGFGSSAPAHADGGHG